MELPPPHLPDTQCCDTLVGCRVAWILSRLDQVLQSDHVLYAKHAGKDKDVEREADKAGNKARKESNKLFH